MKKLNATVALAALAACFAAAPAVAADLAPPPPPAPDWTGFHIGVGGGGMFAFVQEDANSFVNKEDEFFTFGDHSADLGDAAFFGTVEAGFDYQLGSNIVLGLLANYDFGKAKMDNKSNTVVEFPDGDFADNATFETKWEVGDTWAIGARAGFLAMDNALVYVMGGYTEAKVKAESQLSAEDDPFSPGFTLADVSKTSSDGWEDGWFVGGGIEALLTHNISLKAEYRYADYGKVKNNNSGLIDDFAFVNSSQEGDVTVHTVRAVLSYRFGLF